MASLPIVYFDDYMLRPVKESDVNDYFDIAKDPETVKYFSWYAFKHIYEAVKHFNHLYFSNDYPNEPQGYAIVDLNTNKMIGVIDFHTTNKFLNTSHVGYLLHRDYWNLGITSKALKKMLEIGFIHLNFKKIFVQTIEENYSSRRVCEKNNFRLLKILKLDYYHEKTKTYHDVYKYVFERKNYDDFKTKRNL